MSENKSTENDTEDIIPTIHEEPVIAKPELPGPEAFLKASLNSQKQTLRIVTAALVIVCLSLIAMIVVSIRLYNNKIEPVISTLQPTKTIPAQPTIVPTNIASVLKSDSITTIPRNGLVAEYPFDGNGLDTSGNGHNAVIHGATFATDQNGATSSCLYFNGKDNYVDIGSFELGNPITICVWVKYKEFTKEASRIIDFGNSIENDNIRLCNQPGNKFICFDAFNNTNIPSFSIVDQLLPCEKQWLFLSVSISKNKEVKLYQNSELHVISFNNIDIPIEYRKIQRLGCSSETNPIGWLNGYIDNIRIYNRDLDKKEIEYIYKIK